MISLVDSFLSSHSSKAFSSSIMTRWNSVSLQAIRSLKWIFSSLGGKASLKQRCEVKKAKVSAFQKTSSSGLFLTTSSPPTSCNGNFNLHPQSLPWLAKIHNYALLVISRIRDGAGDYVSRGISTKDLKCLDQFHNPPLPECTLCITSMPKKTQSALNSNLQVNQSKSSCLHTRASSNQWVDNHGQT